MSATTWNGRWQKTFTLAQRRKGTYIITNEVMSNIKEGLKDVKIGMLYLFLQHTSAALSINENYDPDVGKDMTMAMESIVPLTLPWKHVDEGLDDSASHVKSALVGVTLTIPISDGKLALGTWQGIILNEFRDDIHTRRVVATIM